MATQSVLIAQDNTSDATWRTWVSGLKSAIDALGTVTQTSDTGQFNPASSTKAAGAYLIYQFTDSLQGSAPVYVRFDVQSGPKFGVSFGTGTNGAGTLTGNTLAVPITGGLTSTTTPQQYLLSGTASRLTMWLEADTAHGAGANSVAVTIERPLDNVGAEVATGAHLLYADKSGGFGNFHVMWISAGTGLPATIDVDHAYCIFPSGAATVGSQTTAFCLNSLGLNFQVQNPFLGLLAYRPPDLVDGEVLPPIQMYGSERTYLAPNPNVGAPNLVAGVTPQLLMLYE